MLIYGDLVIHNEETVNASLTEYYYTMTFMLTPFIYQAVSEISESY